MFHARTDELVSISQKRGWPKFAGLVADLGVGTHQLDDPQRGFGFSHEGPLDMRMDRSQSYSAADVVNRAGSTKLARIFSDYGQERYAVRVARAIVDARKQARIETTDQLARIVRRAVPRKKGPERIDRATRVFQALRIEVNKELDVLERFLESAWQMLEPGGRLAVISFHSLEDRMVKRAFQLLATDCICPPDIPQCICGHKASMKIVTKRPVKPDPEEMERNPRSRSARLRVAERLGPEPQQ